MTKRTRFKIEPFVEEQQQVTETTVQPPATTTTEQTTTSEPAAAAVAPLPTVQPSNQPMPNTTDPPLPPLPPKVVISKAETKRRERAMKDRVKKMQEARRLKREETLRRKKEEAERKEEERMEKIYQRLMKNVQQQQYGGAGTTRKPDPYYTSYPGNRTRTPATINEYEDDPYESDGEYEDEDEYYEPPPPPPPTQRGRFSRSTSTLYERYEGQPNSSVEDPYNSYLNKLSRQIFSSR